MTGKKSIRERFTDKEEKRGGIMMNLRTAEYTNPHKNDEIHHPDHYTWKGTECKNVIEIMTQGLSGAEAYYMGNIIKYLYRYPQKGTLKSDLMKAEEYTKFLRELFTR